jgi:hypothetical protein
MALADKPGFGFDLSHSLPHFHGAPFFVLACAACAAVTAPLGHAFVGTAEQTDGGVGCSAWPALSFTIAERRRARRRPLCHLQRLHLLGSLYWTASGDVLIMTMLGGAGT